MDEAAKQRIAELEDRVDSLSHGQARLERGAVDETGQAWTMADLLNIGLSRRQAMGALASIAGGATLATALTQAVAADASTSDGDGDVGQPGNRVDVFADGVDATSVSTNRTVLSDQGSQPSAVSDSRVLYAKDTDGNIYKVNPDGSEEQLGGSSGSTIQDFEMQTATGDFDDISGSRSVDTTYQNTNSYTIVVIVQLEIDGSTSAETMNTQLTVADNSSDAGVGQNAFDTTQLNNYDDVFRSNFVAWVPPDYYYRVRSFGAETISNWFERGITGN